MRRFAAVLVLCALFDVAAAGGGQWWLYQARFLEDATLQDVVEGRVPSRLRPWDLDGIYPLLVWLQLSGRYTAEHQTLFQAYLDNRSGRKGDLQTNKELIEVPAKQAFAKTLESDGHVVGELSSHRLVKRYRERDGKRIVTSSWINNCRPDAFKTALVTYLKRRERHGAGSVALNRWVEAQIAVFRQCGKDEGGAPAEPDPGWLPLERHDRLYQIAAWHFYRQSYLEAARRFESIAETDDSPWQALARYLVPRSLARQAVVHESDVPHFRTRPNQQGEHLLKQALDRFESLAADDDYLAEFPSVMSQIMRIRVELDDNTFLGHFERRLIEQPSSVDPFDIRDYEWLATVSMRSEDATDRPEEYGRWLRHAVASEKSFARRSDREVAESAVSDLVTALRAERSLPYLYLDLGFAHENVAPADLRDLLAQSRNQTADTLGYLNMLGHRLRVAGMLSDSATADELEREFAEQLTRGISKAAANRIRLQIATYALGWREYVEWSSLLPLDLPWTDAYARSLPTWLFHRITRESRLFPEVTANVINIFSTPKAILDMLDAPGLSDYQRSRLANVGWVRAVMEDDLDTAVEFAPRVGQFAPLLAEGMESFVAAEDKHFEAAWVVLRHPGLSPWLPSGVGRIRWSYGDRKIPASDRLGLPMSTENWWCGGGRVFNTTTPNRVERLPHFLRNTDLEDKYRVEFPTATEFFGPHVIRYARENRTDPRIPQALHRVVFATRYSCSTGPGDISRSAHAILHRDYADNEWTEKTPYWYD